MDITVLFLNLGYAILGALIALIFMFVGYKIFDKITAFDTSEQLADKNIAVGIVVASIFIALALAIGLVVGMGLN